MLRGGVTDFSLRTSRKEADEVMSVVIVQLCLSCTYPKIASYYHSAFCVIPSV